MEEPHGGRKKEETPGLPRRCWDRQERGGESSDKTGLSDYDLIVVEEVGQISCTHFERIWRLWEAVDRRPVLLFVGDFMQLPAIDNTSARDSPWWKEVLATELTILLRSECLQLSEKLGLLRRKCPGEDQLRWILRGHRASAEGATEPHSDEVAAVLAKHPNATLVTYSASCSRDEQHGRDCLFPRYRCSWPRPCRPR